MMSGVSGHCDMSFRHVGVLGKSLGMKSATVRKRIPFFVSSAKYPCHGTPFIKNPCPGIGTNH